MSERIVLDTNMIASALLVQGRVPDQVLDSVISGRSRVIVDGRILREYREVLSRPEFAFPRAEVDELLTLISGSEWVIPDALPLALSDPTDLPFLEVAVAAGADALVTGNPRHFRIPEGELAVAILTPRQYLERLAH